MQHKSRSIALSIKSVADDGTFEGLLSPYGNVDQGGDVVEPGAFANSLKANGNTVPMLWQHKTDCPIGELMLEDRPDGLWCKGRLLLDIPEAQKAYALLKAGIVKGLSIGYETVKSQVVNGVRHLTDLTLFEGSVVTFPMNLSAAITSVKEGRKVSADTRKTLQDAHDHMTAACEAMKSLMDADCAEDETDSEPDVTDDTDDLEAKAHGDLITSMFGLLR